MAYKILGQASLSATTLTDIYTVPTSKSAVVSTIVICNRTNATLTYRIAVRAGGAAAAEQHYIVYDTGITANTSDYHTIGITLSVGDVVSVYASATGMSVSLFGDES